MSTRYLRNFDSTVGQAVLVSKNARSMVDLSITAGNLQHICYTVTAGIVTVLFYILPTLLLVLYPIKSFRHLLSQCRLDFIALNIFIDKIHRDYKNGLNGGRDMRSLSGLYFILRVVIIVFSICHYDGLHHDVYAAGCGILLGCTLMVTWLKPYRNTYPYMNCLDTFTCQLCAYMVYGIFRVSLQHRAYKTAIHSSNGDIYFGNHFKAENVQHYCQESSQQHLSLHKHPTH